VFPIADVEEALAARSLAQRGVTAADAEISRLKAQLRARDAYVVEVERALDEWTRQLAAAGVEKADDLAELVGRARGHAYRAAELESELGRVAAENAELRAALARASEVDDSPLRQVRGIGERYARQLEVLGVVSVEQIAKWTDADVRRYAAALRISASRVAREGWIKQARALCERGEG
jgi:predicted flap endonuclease-1-like 5' DNA nuclease